MAQISLKRTENKTGQLFLSTIDSKYAFGQINLDEDISKHCVFTIIAGKITEHYGYIKCFYGLVDMTCPLYSN